MNDRTLVQRAIRRGVAEEIALALEVEARRHSVPTAAMVLEAIAAPIARQIGSKEKEVRMTCERFVHTDQPDMDWVCVCGHDTDWHGMGPSNPGGPCAACAESAPYTEQETTK